MKAARQENTEQGASRSSLSVAPLPRTRARHSSGLRFRLSILLLLALLPAFTTVLYAGYRGRAEAQRHAQRHALNLILDTAGHAARIIDATEAGLRVLGTMPAVTRGGASCRTSMLRYALALPGLASIGVADATGRVVCSVSAPGIGALRVPDRLHFRRSLAQKHFLVDDYRGDWPTGEPVLLVVHAILAAGSRTHYVLFAVLRVDWFNEMASRAYLPSGSVVTVFDREGHVLARYLAGNPRSARQVPGAGVFRQLVAGRRAWAGNVAAPGSHWILAGAFLGSSPALHGILVTGAIPAAAAYGPAEQNLYRDLLAISLVGLVGLLLTWFVGDRLVLAPIRRLVRVARRIGSGDLTTRAQLEEGPYEIAILGGAFDDMAAALEERALQSDAQNRRIARLNRIYQVLSAINGAIIRIRDRDQLLQEACRIAVELGRFPVAWVGFVVPGDTVVRPVAHAGGARAFVQGARVTIDPNEPEGAGVIGEAIRSGKHVVSNDVESDPRVRIRLEEFRELHIRSAAAFPLRIQSRVVGVLALNAAEVGYFDRQELALLDELAADTSLGLEHIEKEHQLNYLAYWDPLTNLPNRSLLTDRLEQSLRRAERSDAQVIVLVVDIVRFARINDSKGRAGGDRVLQTVAARLETVVRDSESLADLGAAARLGSHEFALVLDEVDDLVVVGQVADRVRAALDPPVALEDEEITVAVRMGASAYPHDGTEAEDLLHKAQFALHGQAEDRLGHLAFYSAEKDTAAKARFALETALRDAVEAQELFLEYQPRVDARTGQLVGAEALLRWNRPGYGRIPPDLFIPILTETGLIEQVGEWVARTALAQRLAWRDCAAETFVISVNASSQELRSPDYVSRMQRLVKALGVPPQWLEIEITESGLVESGSATVEMLSALKALGIRLSVDDFGTGYCSLSYLRQFPVDTLKIDQSFVRDIARDRGALSIVRSIVSLGNALNLTVVAEGVETEQQLQLLRAEGCHEIQGYYFSRPVAPEVLQGLFAESSPFRI